jgi:hypothetical protein
VAIRTCPLCMTKVPAGWTAAYSDGMECPGCKTRLGVADASRMLATFAGLLAAGLVWRLTRDASGMLSFVLPLVYAFLAYSIVSPLFLMFTADLRVRPAEAVPEPAPSAANGHGGHH